MFHIFFRWRKMITVLLAAFLTLVVLTACERPKERFETSWFSYFDTVSTVVGYERSRQSFDQNCAMIENQLREYNQLYDIYNTYDGVNNLRIVNDNAGKLPVEVDERILDLLDYGIEMYHLSDGKVNIALGSVLRIWHDHRQTGLADAANATLPSQEELETAAAHTDITKVIINREKHTVYLADENMSLDVGAIAKGYAAEQIAQQLIEQGVDQYSLNLGGNIRTIGKKADGQAWTAGIMNPDTASDQPYALRVNLSNQALVTSGSYQRFYEVNGCRYHHIIDPDTLFPKDDYASVSILSDNSALADALSTAVFNMPPEDGKRLINSMEDTEALWITPDGKTYYTDGFGQIMIEQFVKE